MAKKKAKRYSLSVAIHNYTTEEGENKNVWREVGLLWVNVDGTPGTILLDRSFNPAGVPIDPQYPNSGRLYVNAFLVEEG